MAEKDSDGNGNGKKTTHSALWGKVATGALGALILGLQGVNLSEVAGVSAGGEKRQVLLEQILSLSQDMKQSLENQSRSLANQTKILENGSEILQRDDVSFKNQEEIIKTLKAAIDDRRNLLQQNLDELKKQQKAPGG
jgi:hypothetical protein